MRAWRIWSICGFAFLAISSPIRANAADATGEAEVLFQKARKLMTEERYSEAWPLLERSEALDPGIGTELHLARCYELGGRPASAWVMYQRVIDVTRQAGQSEREEAARRLQADVAPRVSHATIRPTADAARIAGLEIRCDGAPLDRVAWGRPTPFDPGAHVVEASAPGMDAWKTSFAITRDGQALDVEVPALTPHREEPPPEAASAFAPTQRKIAVVTFSAAVVAAGVGSYFGILTFQKRADYDAAPASDRPRLLDEKTTAGNISTGVFIGAGALLATSVILWITAPRATPARSVLLVPALTPASGSLLLTTAF